MQALQFPMILKHRSDPHAQIVVASAEQLAEVPEDFRPLTVDTAASAVAAAASADLDAVHAELDARRKALDESADEFATYVLEQTQKIDAARAELQKDADELAAQQDALSRERAEFEALRATAAAPVNTMDGEPVGDKATAPAKRTRAAKEGA